VVASGSRTNGRPDAWCSVTRRIESRMRSVFLDSRPNVVSSNVTAASRIDNVDGWIEAPDSQRVDRCYVQGLGRWSCLSAIPFSCRQDRKSRPDAPIRAHLVGTSGIERHETSSSQRYLNPLRLSGSGSSELVTRTSPRSEDDSSHVDSTACASASTLLGSIGRADLDRSTFS